MWTSNMMTIVGEVPRRPEPVLRSRLSPFGYHRVLLLQRRRIAAALVQIPPLQDGTAHQARSSRPRA